MCKFEFVFYYYRAGGEREMNGRQVMVAHSGVEKLKL